MSNNGEFTSGGVTRVTSLPTPAAGLRGQIYYLSTLAGSNRPGYYVISEDAIEWAPTIEGVLAQTDEITLETFDDAGTNKSRIKDGGVSSNHLAEDALALSLDGIAIDPAITAGDINKILIWDTTNSYYRLPTSSDEMKDFLAKISGVAYNINTTTDTANLKVRGVMDVTGLSPGDNVFVDFDGGGLVTTIPDGEVIKAGMCLATNKLTIQFDYLGAGVVDPATILIDDFGEFINPNQTIGLSNFGTFTSPNTTILWNSDFGLLV